jgi:MFS transporter, DHA1 family, tetracycline resistance protein
VNGPGRLRSFLYLPRSAWILTSTSSLWTVGSAIANPYQTLYFSALGASPLAVGLLIAYGTAVTILALLVGGYVADTWGRKRVILVFSWVSVASALMYALTPSYYYLVLPLTLASMASIYTPAFNSVMMDEIPAADRIRGFAVFNVINTIPSMFVPTFGGLLMTEMGILDGVKVAYLASALFGTVAVTVRSLRLRETYLPSVRDKQPLSSYVRESLTSSIRAARRASTLVKRLLLYVTLAGIGTGLTSPFVSIYVVDHLRISPLSYALVVDLAGVTTVALMLTVIFMIRRWGARKSVLLASTAAPLSNVVFLQAKTMDELLEWGVTGAIATAIQTPSIATMQAETISPSDRGRILAMFSLLPALVSLPSQVAAGFLYTTVSPAAPFLVSLVPFAAAAAVLYSAR